MTIEIRPPVGGRAAGGDGGRRGGVRLRARGPRLGARAEDPAPVARARGVRRRQGGRARSGVRIRPLDPGRGAAVRRRHLGRRPADAPPPRDPARLHAAGSSPTSRLGRADRGALGVGGVDLRPLRLRRGGARFRREVQSEAVRAQGRAAVEPERQADRRRRGVPALPGDLRPRSARAGRGCSRARRHGGRSCGSPTRRSGGAARARSSTPSPRWTGTPRATRPTASRTSGRTASPRARCASSSSSAPRRRSSSSSGASSTRST